MLRSERKGGIAIVHNFSSATLFSVELILMYYRDTDEEIHHSHPALLLLTLWYKEYGGQNKFSLRVHRQD